MGDGSSSIVAWHEQTIDLDAYGYRYHKTFLGLHKVAAYCGISVNLFEIYVSLTHISEVKNGAGTRFRLVQTLAKTKVVSIS